MSKHFASNGQAITLPTVQGPPSLYSDAVNKTIVGWSGVGTDPYAAEYDHGADSWTDPVQIGTNPLTEDTHGTPTLVRDDNGTIHAFYGVHGENGQLTHATSDNPDDATTWTEQGSILSGCTYPSPVNIGGDLYIFLRFYNGGDKNKTGYIVSTDNGSSWSAKNDLVQMGSNDWPYHWGVWPDGDIVHILFTVRYGSGTPNDLYHYRYDTVNDTILTQDGTDLGTPPIDATTVQNNTTIHDSGGSHCAQAKLKLDGNGDPHIVYTEDTGTYDWRYINWDGSAWTTPTTITTKGGRRRSPAIDVVSESDITAWLTTEVADGWNGDIEQWSYNGSSWSQDTIVYDEADHTDGAGAPSVPSNYSAPINVVFGQDDHDDFTNSDLELYAYGGDGYVTETKDEISAEPYTTPNNDTVDFTLESYTPSDNDSVDFQFSGGTLTVKVWDGSQWIAKPIAVWDGSQWIEPSALLTVDTNLNWVDQS